MKITGKFFAKTGMATALLALAAFGVVSTVRVAAQGRSQTKDNRALDGTPLNPLDELQRRAERSAREKHFNELKASASELAELGRKVSDEIEKGGQDVISAKIFEHLDKMEKLVKQVRNKAKDGM
jgi:hypothetical protein